MAKKPTPPRRLVSNHVPSANGHRDIDWLLANRLEMMSQNTMTANDSYTQPWPGREWMRRQVDSLDPRRSIDDECGWPATGAMDAAKYQQLYDRDPIAHRVVSVWPRECWQVQPMVYESEDADEATPFEKAWDELSRTIRSQGGESFYKEEEASPVWEYLKRADEQSRIGHYGALLLGIDDGLSLDQPAKGIDEQGSNPSASTLTAEQQEKKDKGGDVGQQPSHPTRPSGNMQLVPYRIVVNAEEQKGAEGKGKPKLTFLRVFPEQFAQVTRWETNPTSPRYGQPVEYLMTFNDPNATVVGLGLPQTTARVHWTRVIHVADNLASSEVIGVPAMRPVLNELLDLRKVRGADAEGYWKGAFMGLSFETHPQLGGDVDIDYDEAKDQIENYFNSHQRYLAMTGVAVKTLAPSVVDPEPHIKARIIAICIQLAIPERIFCGSERGELASSQDDAAWNDRLKERQQAYITPRIIVPFVDRLIMLGILPKPNYKPKPKVAPLGPGDQPDAMQPPVDEEGNPTGDAPPAQPGKPAAAFGGEEDVAAAPVPSKKKPPFAANLAPFAKEEDKEPPSAEGEIPPPDEAEASLARVLDEGAGDELGDETDPAVTGADEGPPGYRVEWPDITSTSAEERAKVLALKTKAYADASAGGVFQTVHERDYMTKFDDFTEEEADAMLEAAQENVALAEAEQAALEEDYGMHPEAPEGMRDPEMEDADHEKELEIIEAKGEAGIGQVPPMGGPPTPPGKPGVGSKQKRPFGNVFCPTGEGGGIDPTCSLPGKSLKEERRLQKKYQEDPEFSEPTSTGTMGKYYRDGKWDESRKLIHDEIRNSFSEKVEPDKQLKDGVLYMTGGGFGSGKSTLLDSFPEKVGFPLKSQVSVADPDHAKKFIPEFRERIEMGDRGAASYVHEESSQVSKEVVSEQLKRGHSLIYDTSGDSSPKKLHDKVQGYRAEGAKRVEAHYATPLSFDEAVRRTTARAQKAGGDRRELTRTQVEVNHREVSRCWQAAAERGTFDHISLWSTAGKFGDPPTRVAWAENRKITVEDQDAWSKFVSMGK